MAWFLYLISFDKFAESRFEVIGGMLGTYENGVFRAIKCIKWPLPN